MSEFARDLQAAIMRLQQTLRIHGYSSAISIDLASADDAMGVAGQIERELAELYGPLVRDLTTKLHPRSVGRFNGVDLRKPESGG